MRKILLLLLLLPLLLPCPGRCEACDDRLSQLDVISQRDPRFRKEVYNYSGNTFSGSGCMPSSILNALVSTLGNAQTDSTPLLLELLQSLSVQDSYKYEPVQNHRLHEVLTANDRRTPQLNRLVSCTSSVTEVTVCDSPGAYVRQITRRSKPAAAVISRLEAYANRRWLCELARELTQAGHGNARIALSCLGVGTQDTPEAPFLVAGSGHYVTLYFEAASFHQEGTFYLLDSYPRALHNEAWGSDTPFAGPYAFTEHPHKGVDAKYTADRLTDTIIKFSLTKKELEKLARIEADSRLTAAQRQQKRLDLREFQLEPVQVFGTAVMILYLP